MQICGLRAIMGEKRSDLIPGVLQALLFEFRGESFRTDLVGSVEGGGLQMGPIDTYKFCLGNGGESEFRDKAYE